MSGIRKFIFPFLFSICWLGAFLILMFALDGADISGLVFYLGFLIILFFILIPLYSFLYSRKLLLNEKRKHLFALYNAFVITMSYFLPFCAEGETYIYSIILFLWSAFWSILPLIVHKNDKTSTK